MNIWPANAAARPLERRPDEGGAAQICEIWRAIIISIGHSPKPPLRLIAAAGSRGGGGGGGGLWLCSNVNVNISININVPRCAASCRIYRQSHLSEAYERAGGVRASEREA